MSAFLQKSLGRHPQFFSGNVHIFIQGHYHIPFSMSATPNAIGYPHLGGIRDDP